jgi:putative endonuclease
VDRVSQRLVLGAQNQRALEGAATPNLLRVAEKLRGTDLFALGFAKGCLCASPLDVIPTEGARPLRPAAEGSRLHLQCSSVDDTSSQTRLVRSFLRDNCDLRMPESAAMAVYHIYILASASGVLYIGVTNHLQRRVTEHKQQLCSGFTKKYEVFRLVYFEPFGHVRNAISREKQLKRWRRDKKLALIRGMNPKFRDLSEDFPQ